MADKLIYRILNRSQREISPIIAKMLPGFFAPRLKNPVFLIGCARSGTTILAQLLGMHKDIANWSEANEILDPDFYPWRPSVTSLPIEYDPVKFTERWWESARPRKKELRAIFGVFQALNQKKFFLNKSPFNTYRIPHLLNIFPKAKFIHIVRDGRAVAYSYARKNTQENKIREWPEPQKTLFEKSFDEFTLWLASYWKLCIEEVEKQEKELGLREKGIFHEISYESICANQQQAIEDICSFIGIDSTRFRSSYYDQNIRSQNSKWRESLKPQTVVKIMDSIQPVLAKRGYA